MWMITLYFVYIGQAIAVSAQIDSGHFGTAVFTGMLAIPTVVLINHEWWKKK